MSENDDFLFELKAPSSTKILNIMFAPRYTAMAVHPVLPGENPDAPLPATELSPQQRQTLLRRPTIAAHRKVLHEAIASGEIQMIHHITRMPVTDSNPEYVDHQLMSFNDFIKFSAKLRIKVVVADADDTSQTVPVQPEPPEKPANGPLPLPTGVIAHAFDGLRGWDVQAWKDALGTPPLWLKACRVIPGRRGGNPTHWNPVLIGAALVHNGHAQPKSVRAKFQSMPLLLGPWLEAWETYEADNFDTQ